MNKKIAIFCDNFYPNVDGVVKVINNYGKVLSKNNDVALIVPDYKDGYNIEHEYKVVRKKAIPIKLRDYILPLPLHCRKTDKFLKEHKSDVYHVHSPFYLGHYALKQGRRNHVPVIATFHSQFKRDYMERTHSRFLTWIAMRFTMRFFNRCDEVWAVSNATANTLRSYGYKKDIFIARNGTAFTYPENMAELKEMAKAQYGIDSNKKCIIYVGQIREIKNIRLIINSINLLSKERDDFHFYFIGDGLDESKFKKYVHKLELDNFMTFVGRISGGQGMQGFLGNADLMFFPSVYDNSSIAVQEACVCGVPVLFTEGSNTSEGFKDHYTGYLAKENPEAMKDKLNYILDHDKERKEVGQRASKEMPRTWEEVISEAEKRYDVVIENYKSKHK